MEVINYMFFCSWDCTTDYLIDSCQVQCILFQGRIFHLGESEIQHMHEQILERHCMKLWIGYSFDKEFAYKTKNVAVKL